MASFFKSLMGGNPSDNGSHQEASKEMVYNVYANVIMLIDEIEGRNKDKEIQKLALSPNSRQELKGKCKTQLQQQLECQVILFKSQLESCDRSIVNDVKDRLKHLTQRWNDNRSHGGYKGDESVERSVKQLLDLLGIRRSHRQTYLYSPSKPPKVNRDLKNQRKSYSTNTTTGNPKIVAEDINPGIARLLQVRPDLADRLSKFKS